MSFFFALDITAQHSVGPRLSTHRRTDHEQACIYCGVRAMSLLGLLLDLGLANGMGLVPVDIAFLGDNNSEFRVKV